MTAEPDACTSAGKCLKAEIRECQVQAFPYIMRLSRFCQISSYQRFGSKYRLIIQIRVFAQSNRNLILLVLSVFIAHIGYLYISTNTLAVYILAKL